MKHATIAVLDTMERIGGGFASALAIAWKRADLENQRKLMYVFKDLYDSYEELEKYSKPVE